MAAVVVVVVVVVKIYNHATWRRYYCRPLIGSDTYLSICTIPDDLELPQVHSPIRTFQV